MVYSELQQTTDRYKNQFPWLQEAKYFERVDATQKRILQWLPKKPEGAVLVVAESQTKGEGRNGRKWESPVGGLWFTLAIPLNDLTLEKVAPFSLVSSLIVAQSLKEVNNLECDLKWPNDVLYDGKKIAGILLTTTTKYKQSWLLIGVGINVNNELSAALSGIATSIKAVRKQSQGRSRLLEAVLDGFWNAWLEYPKTGFGPYSKAFEDRMNRKNQSVTIALGKKSLSGTVVGIDPQGSLLLKSGSGTKSILAGEIVG